MSERSAAGSGEELVAVLVDVLGDELPCTIDDLRAKILFRDRQRQHCDAESHRQRD